MTPARIGSRGRSEPSTAAVVNLAATNGTAGSYLTAFASRSRPVATNLNFGPGQTIANAATVPVGTAGVLALFNAEGSADSVGDASGFYAPY